MSWKNLILAVVPNFDFLLLQALAVTLTAILLRGMKITSLLGPFITVILVSWFNNLYWDSSLFFGLPTNFTFNAIGLVICNSIILWAVIKVSPGIEIKGFLTPIKASIVLSVTSILINKYASDINWTEVLNFLIGITTSLRDYFLTNSTKA